MSDDDYAPRQWHPDERPTLPGGPSFPRHSTPRRIAFFLIGTLVTLTGGLGNALVTVNLVNLQGTLGVFAAERGDVFALRRWFTLTFVLGLIFLLGQGNEYRNLMREGIHINTDGYGSMFFLATGFHGLHVAAGLLAFIFYMVRTTMGRFTPAQATAAIVVSYYWHFVDIVWIGLFTIIYLIK